MTREMDENKQREDQYREDVARWQKEQQLKKQNVIDYDTMLRVNGGGSLD